MEEKIIYVKKYMVNFKFSRTQTKGTVCMSSEWSWVDKRCESKDSGDPDLSTCIHVC